MVSANHNDVSLMQQRILYLSSDDENLIINTINSTVVFITCKIQNYNKSLKPFKITKIS